MTKTLGREDEMSYNVIIYGKTEKTAEQIIQQLKEENCFISKVLMVWPRWFGSAEFFTVRAANLLKSKTQQPLSNTIYFID